MLENDTAFTDTLGNAQAARTFTESRVATGGTASYPWLMTPDVRIAPYLGLYTDFFIRQRAAGGGLGGRHPERLVGARDSRRDVDVCPRRTVGFARRGAWRHRRGLRPLVGQCPARLAVLTAAAGFAKRQKRAYRLDWRVGANSTPGVRPSRCQEQL